MTVTTARLWAIGIAGTAYWAASEIAAGRWSYRQVNLQRAEHLLRDASARDRQQHRA